MHDLGLMWLDEPLPGTAGAVAIANLESEMRLTARQTELPNELTTGRSNKEIGSALGIAEGTVKVMLHHLYRLTGTKNRTALVMMYTGARDWIANGSNRSVPAPQNGFVYTPPLVNAQDSGIAASAGDAPARDAYLLPAWSKIA